VPEDRDARIAELTEAAEQIAEGVNALNRETGGQLVNLAVRARRNRMMIWGLALSLLLDFILTVFIVHLTFQVDDAQQLTRNQVLCPLYQQFVNSDTPTQRERARQAGQDLKARDEAFAVIHKSYDALRCANKR
jgi:hypothetical protein